MRFHCVQLAPDLLAMTTEWAQPHTPPRAQSAGRKRPDLPAKLKALLDWQLD